MDGFLCNGLFSFFGYFFFSVALLDDDRKVPEESRLASIVDSTLSPTITAALQKPTDKLGTYTVDSLSVQGDLVISKCHFIRVNSLLA